ncbi:hypothetical protein EAO14_28205 [Klebsiella pneumoniae]|nr:hypothetical protein EAO14_28205 [Klebsiella pneumoniae]
MTVQATAGLLAKIIAALRESSAAAMETIRLTLIPLGEQYATEADAQAAINNERSPLVHFVRSTDDSALAVEY